LAQVHQLFLCYAADFASPIIPAYERHFPRRNDADATIRFRSFLHEKTFPDSAAFPRQSGKTMHADVVCEILQITRFATYTLV
jgi:hypothetical protein